MNRRTRFLITYKILFALLAFSALVTEVATIVDRGVFNAGNFFSFFTVESNLLITVALILSALTLAAGKKSRALDVFRGFTTTLMIIVGIGFAVLLSGLENVALTAVPWDNTVLHYILPIVAVLDYVIDRPTTRLGFARSLAWLLYPLAYLFYSLVRGSITGWYPYPFLNPNHSSTQEIVIASVGILVLGVLAVLVTTKLSGVRKKI